MFEQIERMGEIMFMKRVCTIALFVAMAMSSMPMVFAEEMGSETNDALYALEVEVPEDTAAEGLFEDPDPVFQENNPDMFADAFGQQHEEAVSDASLANAEAFYAFTSVVDPEPPVMQPHAGHAYDTKRTGSTLLTKQFVRYLTSSWAQASSYTWTKSNTTSWTYSGSLTNEFASKARIQLGLSNSRTTSYSVATVLPANPRRDSKLGFFSDFNKVAVTVTKSWVSDLGKIIPVETKSGYVHEPTMTTYLSVVYK